MLFQYILLKDGASSSPETFYVDSDTKENGLSALVNEKRIDVSKYKMVLGIDMTKQIIIDTEKTNSVSAVFDEDTLRSVDKGAMPITMQELIFGLLG